MNVKVQTMLWRCYALEIFWFSSLFKHSRSGCSGCQGERNNGREIIIGSGKYKSIPGKVEPFNTHGGGPAPGKKIACFCYLSKYISNKWRKEESNSFKCISWRSCFHGHKNRNKYSSNDLRLSVLFLCVCVGGVRTVINKRKYQTEDSRVNHLCF